MGHLSSQPVPVDYPNMMMPMGGYGYDEYDGAGYETMPGIYAPQPQPVLFNSDMDGANNRGISPQAPGTLSSLMTFWMRLEVVRATRKMYLTDLSLLVMKKLR